MAAVTGGMDRWADLFGGLFRVPGTASVPMALALLAGGVLVIRALVAAVRRPRAPSVAVSVWMKLEPEVVPPATPEPDRLRSIGTQAFGAAAGALTIAYLAGAMGVLGPAGRGEEM